MGDTSTNHQKSLDILRVPGVMEAPAGGAGWLGKGALEGPANQYESLSIFSQLGWLYQCFLSDYTFGLMNP